MIAFFIWLMYHYIISQYLPIYMSSPGFLFYYIKFSVCVLLPLFPFCLYVFLENKNNLHKSSKRNSFILVDSHTNKSKHDENPWESTVYMYIFMYNRKASGKRGKYIKSLFEKDLCLWIRNWWSWWRSYYS